MATAAALVERWSGVQCIANDVCSGTADCDNKAAMLRYNIWKRLRQLQMRPGSVIRAAFYRWRLQSNKMDLVRDYFRIWKLRTLTVNTKRELLLVRDKTVNKLKRKYMNKYVISACHHSRWKRSIIIAAQRHMEYDMMQHKSKAFQLCHVRTGAPYLTFDGRVDVSRIRHVLSSTFTAWHNIALSIKRTRLMLLLADGIHRRRMIAAVWTSWRRRSRHSNYVPLYMMSQAVTPVSGSDHDIMIRTRRQG